MCEPVVQGEPWSRFRGPNASGIGEGTDYPVEFGPTRNVIWRRPFPPGKSSPVLTKGRILLTAELNDLLKVISVDRATGHTAWERSVERLRKEFKNPLNDGASSSAVTDGANVYGFFGDFGLISFDESGRERWRTPIEARSSLWGTATSPVLAGDTVVVLLDGFARSSIVGFDAKTGDRKWEIERPPFRLNYSTPLVGPSGAGCRVLAVSPNEITAYDPANGERRWSEKLPPGTMIASPVFADPETVIAMLVPAEEVPPFPDKDSDGAVTPADIPTDPKDWLVRRTLRLIADQYGDRDGEITSAEWTHFWRNLQGTPSIVATGVGPRRGLKWSYAKGIARVPTPLYYRDIVYYVNNGGILTALNGKTGAALKVGRLRGAIDNYYASPVAADGRIYLVSESGKAPVVQAGADWEVSVVNDLDEPCYATPALSEGRVFLRTAQSLYCFGR
jgi:outer membrane protein assembly factor BamB